MGDILRTLPGHAERGEERFSIEWHRDDTVWYDLLAFSRPGHWLIWLGYPCVRRLQRRFALASLAAMVRAVAPYSGGSVETKEPTVSAIQFVY